MNYIYFCIISIVIITLYFYFTKRYASVNFTDNNTSVNNFTDSYFDDLTLLDLQARKVNSIEEYKSSIIIEDFDYIEKERLINLCHEVDRYLYYNSFINYTDIDFFKLSMIPWNFIKINSSYEAGLPHTREIDQKIFVVLSQDVVNKKGSSLKRILLHEKIHVYQKLYPLEVQKYIHKLGYKKFKLRKKIKNIRSNPDLDNFVYIKDGKQFLTVYKNNPKSINDTITYPVNDHTYEHPYEIMAYDIANVCVL